MIFSVFHTEDGLARGTTLWTDCVGWLQDLCKEDSSDEWFPKSLNEFLMTSVNSLLQINQGKLFLFLVYMLLKNHYIGYIIKNIFFKVKKKNTTNDNTLQHL